MFLFENNLNAILRSLTKLINRLEKYQDKIKTDIERNVEKVAEHETHIATIRYDTENKQYDLERAGRVIQNIQNILE